MKFYWELGKDIEEMYAESSWGSHFFAELSKDLKKKIPGAKCFSKSNLRYMHRFYKLFPIVPQVGEQLYHIPWGHVKLLIDKCQP